MRRWKRPVSLVLTFVLLFGIVYIVMLLIVPAVSDAVTKIINTVPSALNLLLIELKKWNIPAEDLEQWISNLTINWSDIGQKVLNYLSHLSTGVLSSTFGVLSSVVQGTANTVISLIFAIYILCSKEKLYRQLKMIIYAFLPEKIGDEIYRIGSLVHKTFSNFFAGQCLEACILGMMFLISMTVLRIPYAVLIGVLIAITALIPVFGAFIGCITGAILIVMVDPMKALVFLILFLVLQQLEGNLIYPKVVGNSVGLPSIWVLVAVTLGASVSGVVGMILFIPLFSVAYSLISE
ncbi:MAG: AI-2E family transporter, partial [Lachnospiraceae bacterium]|nr:AI-2E family transporter [Lachnospiraceae bacterium]